MRARPTELPAGVLLAGVLAAGGLGLAGCDADATGSRAAPSMVPSMTTPTTSPTTAPTPSTPPTDRPRPPADLEVALSEPVEDSVYPDVGDPGVDALHYDLALAWDPSSDTLTGTETLTFRSTETADGFQLDLARSLEVTSLSLDGAETTYEHAGKDLVVNAPVVADRRYRLVVTYAGTPRPVAAPTTRSDLSTVGLTIDDEHQVWTMQEPFGAYTWYAVNDHPSDKALYDFTLEVPSPWTGIANGAQVLDQDDGTTRTTGFSLAEPAASYLVTLAFGDYRRTTDTGPGGVPIVYWTPSGEEVPEGLRTAPDAMRWLERRLGPYPFDTAGFVLVDSLSGMETQTMITLGDNANSTSPEVVLHELAHQWYGDQVTPADWRDVWMNEGMAMYLQLMWQAEQERTPIDDYLAGYAGVEADFRAAAGPPGAYEPGEFGSSNIYFSGAFLWHALRERVGDPTFFRAVKGWPAAQDNTSTDRETLLAYLERETGEQLDGFWDAWLLGERTPPLS